jgi:Methylamine utilisation protein MauE
MPEFVAYGISGFIAWLMALAAWHKWSDPAAYRAVVVAYLGGAPVSAALVPLVAALEAGIALALLVPASRQLALVAAAALLLAYAALMGLQVLQGRRDLRCGCAGPDAAVTVSPVLVGRNLCCVALALAALQVQPTTAGAVSALLAASLLAVFLVLTYLCCEHLIGNAQRMAKGI